MRIWSATCALSLAVSPFATTQAAKASITEQSERSISNAITCLRKFNRAASQAFYEGKAKENWEQACDGILGKLEEIRPGNQDSTAVTTDALQNNLSLKAESLRLSSSIDAYNAEVARRNPQASLNFTSQINSQYFPECSLNESIQVGVACETIIGLEPINNPFSYYQIGSNETPVFSLSYDLMNLEQDQLIRAANLKVDESRSKNLEFRKNTAKSILEASDTLSLAMQKLIVRESIVQLYEYSLRAVESQLEAGFTTIVEVDRVKSKLETAKQEKNAALEELYKATKNQDNILSRQTSGIEAHSIFITNPFAEIISYENSQLISDALNKSPDIIALRKQSESLGMSASAAWKKLWPIIQASVNYSPEVASAIMGNSSIWQSGISQVGAQVGITWSFFDSGTARSEASGFTKKQESVLLKLEQLTIEKLNQIAQESNDIKVGSQQLINANNAASDLSTALLGTELRLNAGFEDVTSLIQTVETFTSAQIQYLDSIKEQNQRYRNLAFTTNNYVSKELKDDLSEISW